MTVPSGPRAFRSLFASVEVRAGLLTLLVAFAAAFCGETSSRARATDAPAASEDLRLHDFTVAKEHLDRLVAWYSSVLGSSPNPRADSTPSERITPW